MTVINEPKQDKYDDNLLVIVGGWILFAALIVGAFFGIHALFGSSGGNSEKPEDTDATAFCAGWVNGVAYAVRRVTGDQGFAVAYATGQIVDVPADKAVPPCDPSGVVIPEDPSVAWCVGLVEGYIAVSVGPLEQGPPPEGWRAESVIGCVDGRMFETPVVPDTQVGGGGPPPSDN